MNVIIWHFQRLLCFRIVNFEVLLLMGGQIPEIKLTAKCLVHCAVYYYLFFIGTIIIINHVWFQI